MDLIDHEFQPELPEEPAGERPRRGHMIAGIALAVLGIARLTMNDIAKSVEEAQERREAAWQNRPQPTGMDIVAKDFRDVADAGAELTRSAAEWFRRPIDAISAGFGDNAPLPTPAESIALPDD